MNVSESLLHGAPLQLSSVVICLGVQLALSGTIFIHSFLRPPLVNSDAIMARRAMAGISSVVVLLLMLQSAVPVITYVVAALCAVSFALAGKRLRAGRCTKSEGMREGTIAQWVGFLSVLTVSIAVVALVSINLDALERVLFTWESYTVRELLEARMQGESLLRFVVERFRWDEGLASTSASNPLFGAGAYLATELLGFTPIAIRLPALLSIVLAGMTTYLVLRGRVGGLSASIAGLLMILSPVSLFYAHYGISIATTILTAALLCGITIHLYSTETVGKFLVLSVMWSIAAILSTYGYATARLLLVATLPFVLWIVARKPLPGGVRGAAFVIIAAILGTFIAIQASTQDLWVLFNARGEQVVNFMSAPSQARDYLSRETDSVAPWEVVRGVVKKRWPELVEKLTPLGREEFTGVDRIGDPPSLRMFYPGMLPLLLLGVAAIRGRRYPFEVLYFMTMAAFLASVLLLTSRVDIHRLALLAVPVSFLVGYGTRGALETASEAGLGWMRVCWMGFAVAALFAQAVFSFSALRVRDEFPSVEVLRAVLKMDPYLRSRLLYTTLDQRIVYRLAMYGAPGSSSPLFTGSIAPRESVDSLLAHQLPVERLMASTSDVTGARLAFFPAEDFTLTLEELSMKGCRTSLMPVIDSRELALVDCDTIRGPA